MLREDVASKIAKAREARGLSLRELARLARISAGTIRNIENGVYRPRGSTLRKVLEALNKVPKLPKLR